MTLSLLPARKSLPYTRTNKKQADHCISEAKEQTSVLFIYGYSEIYKIQFSNFMVLVLH
jgi:hypothetical protein